MAIAFVTKGYEFSWGGAVGELLNSWFVKWIGNFGTGSLLIVAVFSYIIWRFNPTFKWPESKPKPAIDGETPVLFEKGEDEKPVYGEWNMTESEHPIPFTGNDPEIPVSTNKLKNDGREMNMPAIAEAPANPLTKFDVNEKTVQQSDIENNEFPLEVKNSAGEDSVEIGADTLPLIVNQPLATNEWMEPVIYSAANDKKAGGKLLIDDY